MIETYAWIYLYIRIAWGLIGTAWAAYALWRVSSRYAWLPVLQKANYWLVTALFLISAAWAGWSIPILFHQPVHQIHWVIFIALWGASLLVGPAAFWMNLESRGETRPA